MNNLNESVNLTARQQVLYNFIVEFIKKEGRCPVAPDMQTLEGFSSPATVTKYIKQLADIGKIIKGTRSSIIAGLPDDPGIMFILSKEQKKIWDFVKVFIEKNKYSPTLKTIANNNGRSNCANVFKHLKNLESKGLIKMGKRCNIIRDLHY